MKLYAFAMIVFSVFCLGPNAFPAEITIGENHLICENKQFGTFDLRFTVNNKVVGTEFYKDETTEPVPSWETLETELNRLEFTSGESLEPSGTKGYLPGATLSVVRNVFPKSAAIGLIQASLTIPKELAFPAQALLIDHNHPERYETSELGAQTFVWLDTSFVQLFFKCR